jgi:hypothetical protein
MMVQIYYQNNEKMPEAKNFFIKIFNNHKYNYI